MTAAFEHAFRWLGFGAKTAVGYGALEVDRARQQAVETEQAAARAEAEREREAAEAERRAREEAARRQALTDAQRQIEDFVAYMQKRYEALRGRPVRANGEEHQRARVIAQAALESADWTAEERRAAAEAIATWLPKVVAVDMKDERKRLKLAQLRGEG